MVFCWSRSTLTLFQLCSVTKNLLSAQGGKSFETRSDRVLQSREERRRRLEDFLAAEQERLQSFLFEESKVLAAPESVREDEKGGGVGEGATLQDPYSDPESETLVKITKLFDLRDNGEVEKVFEELKKEKEKVDKMGGEGKSVEDEDSDDQIELFTTTITPQIRERGNEQNEGVASEKENKNEDGQEHEDKQKQMVGLEHEHDLKHEDEHELEHEQGEEDEGGERLRRVEEECQKDQKFLIKVICVIITILITTFIVTFIIIIMMFRKWSEATSST